MNNLEEYMDPKKSLNTFNASGRAAKNLVSSYQSTINRPQITDAFMVSQKSISKNKNTLSQKLSSSQKKSGQKHRYKG